MVVIDDVHHVKYETIETRKYDEHFLHSREKLTTLKMAPVTHYWNFKVVFCAYKCTREQGTLTHMKIRFVLVEEIK